MLEVKLFFLRQAGKIKKLIEIQNESELEGKIGARYRPSIVSVNALVNLL
jgi:hypothetical protein